MDRLPSELLVQILCDLGWQDQASALNVCRLWRDLIQSSAVLDSRYHPKSINSSLFLHNYFEDGGFIQINFEASHIDSEEVPRGIKVSNVRLGSELNAAYLRGHFWPFRYENRAILCQVVGEADLDTAWSQISARFRKDFEAFFVFDKRTEKGREQYLKQQLRQAEQDSEWMGQDPRFTRDITNSRWLRQDPLIQIRRLSQIPATDDYVADINNEIRELIVDLDPIAKKERLAFTIPLTHAGPGRGQEYNGSESTYTSTNPDPWWLNHRSLASKTMFDAKLLGVFPGVERLLQERVPMIRIFEHMAACLGTDEGREQAYKGANLMYGYRAYRERDWTPTQAFAIRIWKERPKGAYPE